MAQLRARTHTHTVIVVQDFSSRNQFVEKFLDVLLVDPPLRQPGCLATNG